MLSLHIYISFLLRSSLFFKTKGPDKYEWALISGGPPKKQTENGYCETGSGINNSGLWIFTREKVASDATINKIRGIAKGLGFDLDVLQPVVQEGCTYEGVQDV